MARHKPKAPLFGLQDGQARVIVQEDKTRLVVSMNDKCSRKDCHNRRKGLEKL